jgi:hypothetical protein
MRGFDIPQRFKYLPGSGKNHARRMPRQMVSRSRFSLTNFNVFGDRLKLLELEHLVLWARWEFNGFAGKDGKWYWSIGVLECWKKPKL